MGADLYIQTPERQKYNEEHDALFEAFAQLEQEGSGATKEAIEEARAAWLGHKEPEGEETYFRDSYNGTNLLWQLGLDYWQWFNNYLDENGMLKGENLDSVLMIIENATRRELTEEWLKEHRCEPGVAGWNDYFEKKHQQMIAFLQRARDGGWPIYCST